MLAGYWLSGRLARRRAVTVPETEDRMTPVGS
jgi:hypothetical protein